MLETFHLSTFAPHVHTTFRVLTGPDQFIPLEMIEADELGATPRQERFSLIFRGPASPFLPQQVVPMEHDTLGAFTLFLVPIGQEEGSNVYQAVFNRLVKP